MNKVRFILTGLSCALFAACAEEPVPPSVDEYVADKILLDAAMARCSQNRATMKYEPECVNAREAADILARDEEAERRQQLEAESDRKRAALRRAQEAADEARRRAAEAARQREEAEYLAQFSTSPDAVSPSDTPGAPDPATAVPANPDPTIEQETVPEYGAPITEPAIVDECAWRPRRYP